MQFPRANQEISWPPNAAMQNAAKKVLEIGAPYLVCLMVSKVVALLVSEVPMDITSLAQVLVILAALLTLADIAVRIAASRKHSWSFSKHGTDTILCGLFAVQCLSCGKEARPNCRALHLILPFAVLVSLGGNMMRWTRRPKPQGGDAEEVELPAIGGSSVE
eukprot:symbB.v1.2.028145.t1/scaffold2954.1/size66569/2